jgi:hypothetical protein
MRPVRDWLFCFLTMATLLPYGGCNRSYYRRQADTDAEGLIQQKINHPHWDLPRQTIDIDPRSRMFDPFSPDCEPMPPDDPYSHELMHRVDGKKGWRKWHQFGDTPFVENPTWQDYLPIDEQGVLPLDAETAYQLAIVHSRDYQEQFETLYLSALDVSAERFRFDTQFFGGYSAFYTASGRDRVPRSQLTTSLFTDETGRFGAPNGVRAPTSGGINFHRALATGGEFAAGIANSLTWDFAGQDNYSSLTILDFTLVQPLLRLAGRERVLEQLTLSERQLLANVRQMERYRRAFMVEILTGRNAGDGATRRGGFFGGAGLEGFSGVGGGGFGRVGGGGGQQNDTNNLTIPRAGGFLGLLQSQQDIRIQQSNIAGLRSNLAQLREMLRENLTTISDTPVGAIDIVRDRLQIAQARQALLNSETRLLTAEATYQQTLDQFKIDMGLPPTICVALTDPMLDRFNLIDPAIVPLQNEFTSIREQVGVINEQLLTQVRRITINEQPVNGIEWNDDVAKLLTQIRSKIARIKQLRTQLLSTQIQRAGNDIGKLNQSLDSRRQELTRLRRKYLDQREKNEDYGGLDPCQVRLMADIDPAVFDIKRLDTLPGELENEVKGLTQRLTALELPLEDADALLDELLTTPEKPAPADLYRQLESTVIFGIPGLLSLIHARARVDAVELTAIDMPWDMAVEIARRYRHDWMNARAALVDAWRLIYFNADALQSTLDVTFSGDIRNSGDNPFDLSGRQGQLRVGLEFDGPWTRLRERNTYRQALIEYQQARRNFNRYEDFVASSLRDTIRTIELNQLNFEERRIAVLSAIDQIVLNDEIRRFQEEQGLAAGATAARDAVSALTDLQEAQNLFLGIWVNYEALRLILDLDLGTMQLDADGNWIDPGPMGPDYGLQLPQWDSGNADLHYNPVIEGVRPLDSMPRPEPIPPGQPAVAPVDVPQANRLPSPSGVSGDRYQVVPVGYLQESGGAVAFRLPPVVDSLVPLHRVPRILPDR